MVVCLPLVLLLFTIYKLGISPSSAIQMLYSQIVLTRGMPLMKSMPNL
ncbi:MAG: hypothetical protein HFG88_12975 [Dorea sp.]|nr:hypothetical protein [Dorea sp.]